MPFSELEICEALTSELGLQSVLKANLGELWNANDGSHIVMAHKRSYSYRQTLNQLSPLPIRRYNDYSYFQLCGETKEG